MFPSYGAFSLKESRRSFNPEDNSYENALNNFLKNLNRFSDDKESYHVISWGQYRMTQQDTLMFKWISSDAGTLSGKTVCTSKNIVLSGSTFETIRQVCRGSGYSSEAQRHFTFVQYPVKPDSSYNFTSEW
ncbi:MAG: hypothetical protein ACRBF0_09405 [Calditrichia bacterium]